MLEDPLTKGEKTRLALLGAAFELFTENGYHGTSMRKIARRAGLALGGIYNHFANKEEIFTAVILDRHPFTSALPLIAESEGETVEALLRNAATLIVEEVEKRPEILNLIFIELIELDGRHMGQLAAGLLPTVIPFIQRVLARGDELRIDTPLTFMQSFAGLILGYLVSRRLLAETPIGRPAADSLEHLLDIYLHGLLLDAEREGA